MNGCNSHIGQNLIKDIGKLYFVVINRHVSNVRCTYEIVHCKKRIVSIEHRFLLVHVHSRHTGRPIHNVFINASGYISPARLVLTRSVLGFIQARSSAVTILRVASTKHICNERTSHVSKNSFLLHAVA